MALRDPVRRKLTYEDYLLFPEDGNRHEILDGEHFMTAAPTLWHESIVVELTSWIAPFVRRYRLGRLYVAPADVLLGAHDVVQPDLLFVSQARSRILTERNVQGAPDLVIEVLSLSPVPSLPRSARLFPIFRGRSSPFGFVARISQGGRCPPKFGVAISRGGCCPSNCGTRI